MLSLWRISQPLPLNRSISVSPRRVASCRSDIEREFQNETQTLRFSTRRRGTKKTRIYTRRYWPTFRPPPHARRAGGFGLPSLAPLRLCIRAGFMRGRPWFSLDRLDYLGILLKYGTFVVEKFAVRIFAVAMRSSSDAVAFQIRRSLIFQLSYGVSQK